MKFAAKVYSGDVYLGKISSETMQGLKCRASSMCNNYNKPVDSLIVYHANSVDIDEVKYTRINKLSPNNEVIRGKWR